MRKEKHSGFTRVFFLATGLLMLLFSIQSITQEDFLMVYKNMREKMVIKQLDELVRHLEEGLFTEEDLLDGFKFFSNKEEIIKALAVLQEYKEAVAKEEGIQLAAKPMLYKRLELTKSNSLIPIVNETRVVVPNIDENHEQNVQMPVSDTHILQLLTDMSKKKLQIRDQARWYEEA
ncbi:hypothetical protein [Vallitalea okinawensis]|uniref:hypothetical protein n=1 Tax=Vallitalea okinawensis TaxID=2078660 RepID=UPI000CFDD225|nr:hypothetical protein [Vallitalea okinawensis]